MMSHIVGTVQAAMRALEAQSRAAISP